MPNCDFFQEMMRWEPTVVHCLKLTVTNICWSCVVLLHYLLMTLFGINCFPLAYKFQSRGNFLFHPPARSSTKFFSSWININRDGVWKKKFDVTGLCSFLCRSEHEYVIEKTSGLFKLLRNNSETQNAASLLKQFLVRATELKASAQCDEYDQFPLIHWIDY